MNWYTRKKVDICNRCHFAQDFRELGVELKRCPHCGYGQETITKHYGGTAIKLHYNDEKMWFEGVNGDTFQFTNFNTPKIRERWSNLLYCMYESMQELIIREAK